MYARGTGGSFSHKCTTSSQVMPQRAQRTRSPAHPMTVNSSHPPRPSPITQRRVEHSRPKQRRAAQRSQHTGQESRAIHPTDPHEPTPTPSAPRRASSRRAGKAFSRAKQRRVAPGCTKWGSRARGVSVEGLRKATFAPTRPPSPPPDRCE